jgi:hypothetical protein
VPRRPNKSRRKPPSIYDNETGTTRPHQATNIEHTGYLFHTGDTAQQRVSWTPNDDAGRMTGCYASGGGGQMARPLMNAVKVGAS